MSTSDLFSELGEDFLDEPNIKKIKHPVKHTWEDEDTWFFEDIPEKKPAPYFDVSKKETKKTTKSETVKPVLRDKKQNNTKKEDDFELPELDFSDIRFDDEDARADALFDDINAALCEKVNRQFENQEVLSSNMTGTSYSKSSGRKTAANKAKKANQKKKGWKAIPLPLRIVLIILLTIVFFLLFILFTKPGHWVATRIITSIVLNGVNKVDDPTNKTDQNPVDTNNPGIDNPDSPDIPEIVPKFEEDKSVINILLIGEENLFHDNVGRTDAMLIASLDKDGGPLKLVSFMRDLYVAIPGHEDNRLNAVYALGGAELLMKTIELNFGIKCDSYVHVDFKGFEEVIDAIGGLEISLTEEEAKYLQTTNYISDKSQRNVVPGNQLMTGNQVLGYCRVRHRPTANGLTSDFGRTYRQRLVLQKIFSKYKTKSYVEILSTLSKCLPYVTVPKNFEGICADCLQVVWEKKMFDLDTYRIPIEGHYSDIEVMLPGIDNLQKVLAAYPDTVDILHEYLYGKAEDK